MSCLHQDVLAVGGEYSACIQDWHKAGDWQGQNSSQEASRKDYNSGTCSHTSNAYMLETLCGHFTAVDLTLVIWGCMHRHNQSTYCLLQEQHVRSARSGRQIKEPARFDN